MKRLFLVLFFFAIVHEAKCQQSVTWDFMSNVRWSKTYMPSLKEYFDMPLFSIEIKAIAGKEISMKGFFIPVDAATNIFAISQNPSNVCFFCGAAGLASVVEIIPKADKIKAFKRMKTDKLIEVKGTLWLNSTDRDHLMYVLKDAELVSTLK
jgi:hypothetical protein